MPLFRAVARLRADRRLTRLTSVGVAASLVLAAIALPQSPPAVQRSVPVAAPTVHAHDIKTASYSLPSPCYGDANVTCTYGGTGSDQYFSIPAGVQVIHVQLDGAVGGHNGDGNGGHGGFGGEFDVDLYNASGTLDVKVGMQGQNSSNGNSSQGPDGRGGGWPDGGSGGDGHSANNQGCGGGGGSSIWSNGTVLAEAGGGGGCGGLNGTTSSHGNGGQGGATYDGNSQNASTQGGNGSSGNNTAGACASGGGGGGGGGWRGGGGGGSGDNCLSHGFNGSGGGGGGGGGTNGYVSSGGSVGLVNAISSSGGTWNYLTAQVVITYTRSNTSTTLTNQVTSVDAGGPVQLSAVVSPDGNSYPTDQVQFTSSARSGDICANGHQVSSFAHSLIVSCTYYPPTAGTETISAQFGGDAADLSSSTSYQLTVNPIPTTTTIGTVTSTGTTITVPVTVSPPSSDTWAMLDGTVTVSSNDPNVGCAAASGRPTAGQAITVPCTINNAAYGQTYTFAATYSGSSSTAGSTAVQVVYTVPKISTTTTLALDGAQNDAASGTYGDSSTLTATVTAGSASSLDGALTYYSSPTKTTDGTLPSDASTLACTGGTALALKVAGTFTGTCPVSPPGGTTYYYAVYAAGATTATSTSGWQSFDASPATTQVDLSAVVNGNPTNNSTVGDPITLSARVGYTDTRLNGTTPDAATVTFSDGTTQLGTATLRADGTASLVVTDLEPGPHSLTASYAGTAASASQSSGTLSYQVNTVPATLDLAISPSNPDGAGRPITFVATLIPPKGSTVAIGSGTVTIDRSTAGTLTPVCSGLTLSTLVASCSITPAPGSSTTYVAVYDGDVLTGKLSSDPQSYTAPAAASTTTMTVAQPSGTTLGSAVTLNAVVTTEVTSPRAVPTGTVTFTEAGSPVCTATLTAGSDPGTALASCSPAPQLLAGHHDVRAEYAGGPTATASNSGTTTVPVTAAKPVVAVTATTTDSGITLVATVTKPSAGISVDPAGTVTFSGTGVGSSCSGLTLSAGSVSCTASLPAKGTYTYTASYTSSSANFTGASGSGTDTIGDAQQACSGGFQKIWDLATGHGNLDQSISGVGSLHVTASTPSKACNGASVIGFTADASLFGTLHGTGLTGTLADATDSAGHQTACLTGGTLALPTSWNVPSATVTAPICFTLTSGGGFGSLQSGTVTVSKAGLPLVSVPGVGTGDLTLTFGSTSSGTATLTAADTLTATSGIGAALTASVDVTGAVSASLSVTGLSAFGSSIALSGSITRSADGTVTPDVHASIPGPLALATAVSLSGIDIAVGSDGLDVTGTASLGVGTNVFSLGVTGAITSPKKWSLSLTGTSTTPWTPFAGLSITPSFTGTFSYDGGNDAGAGGSFAYDLTLGDGTSSVVSWTPAAALTVGLTELEITNQSAAGCNHGDPGDAVLSLKGGITSDKLAIGAAGCADLNTGSYRLDGTAGTLPIAGGLSLSKVNVTLQGGNGQPAVLTGSGTASVTAGSTTLSTTVALSVAKGVFVVGGSLDLTSLGVPISNGYVAYASAPVTAFDTGVAGLPGGSVVSLPAGLTAQGTVTMTPGVQAALTRAGFSVPNGGAIRFSATLDPSAKQTTFTAALTAPPGFPVLTLPGGSTLTSATLTYTTGTLTLAAAGTIAVPNAAAAPVTLSLTVNSDGSFSGSGSVTGLSVLGQTVTLKGSVSEDPKGKVTSSLSASIPGPITVPGMPGSLSGVTLTLGSGGLTVGGTLAVASTTFTVAGTFTSLRTWSVSVSGDTGTWSPTPGVSLSAHVTGTLARSVDGGLTVDLTAQGSGSSSLLTINPVSGVSLSVSSVELSNGTAPQGCTSTSGDLWFQITGTLAVSVGPANGSVLGGGCFDLTHPAFTFDASVPSLTVSLLGGGVQLTDASVHLARTGSTFTAQVRARLTISMPTGGTFSALATLTLSSDSFVIGTTADLSAYLGSVAANGYIYYASKDVQGFDTGDPTAGKIDLKQGIDVAVSLGLPSGAAAALNHLGLNLPAGSGIVAVGAFNLAARSFTLAVKISLGADGATMFTTSSGASLSYVSTSLQLTIAPTLVSFGLRTDLNLHLPPLESGHPASDVGLTGLINLSGESIDASLTATNWNDAFGISGLNVASLTLQLGVDAEGLPSLGLAAVVDGLPTSLANILGYQQGAPITIALNISADQPLLDFSIGTKDSGTPALKPLTAFGAPNMIVVDFAELYISPFGATIGSTYYPPGLDLALQASLFGVPLDIEVKVDPTAPSLYFKGTVGQITAGALTMGPTTFILDAGPGRFDLEFDGQVHLGPGTVNIGPALRFTGGLDADVALSVGTSGISAHLDFDAYVKGSNYLPQSVCFYKGVLPYPCDYEWVDDAPLHIQATNIGFDLNSSGLTIDIPNTTSSITLPWSSNHSTASASEHSLTGRDAAAPAVLQTGHPGVVDPPTVITAAPVAAHTPAPVAATKGSTGPVSTPSAGGRWQSVSSLPGTAYFPASATLPGGHVLVAGGLRGSTATADAASYDPKSGAWTVLPPMHQARVGAAAVPLRDGRVLVVGGADASGALASAEIYDPAKHTWTQTGSMATPRQLATVTPLADGRVLVAGGRGPSGTLSSAELWTPSTGRWTGAGTMTTPRVVAAGALLANGSVLVAGGIGGGTTPLASAELFDPATGTWRATTPMPHAAFGGALTTLTDGSVLASGDTAFAERYHPATARWTNAGTQSEPRLFAGTTRLADGRVLVAGGLAGQVGQAGRTLATTDVYDPVHNVWQKASDLPSAVAGAGIAVLPDGSVLLAGGGVGHDAGSPRSGAALWHPVADTASAPLGGVQALDVRPFGSASSSSTTGWVVLGGSIGGVLLLLMLVLGLSRRRRPGTAAE